MKRLLTWASVALLSATLSFQPESLPAQERPTVRLLDAQGDPLLAGSPVGITHHIPNDAALPRDFARGGSVSDPDALRVEVVTSDGTEPHITASLVSEGLDGRPRGRLALELRRVEGGRYRSPWLRLVGDLIDLQAPGAASRLLLVALGDVLVLRAQGQEARYPVGATEGPDGPRRVLRGHLRLLVVRDRPGGALPIGGTAHQALALAREQVRVANEIWMQCFIHFGDAAEAEVRIVDPPPPALLAVGGEDGLPALGGQVELRADGRRIQPVPTLPGASPLQVALQIAAALEAEGFSAVVTENQPVEFAAGPTADVLVRRRGGGLASLAVSGQRPLSTDPGLSVEIGQVDLTDGLQEFDNMNAVAGTLEERTLIKALADDDPTTIDVFIVSRFQNGTRQGEAFIESEGGAIANVLVLDRNGIRQQRAAWTIAHELGHILLDQPYHPDNVGPDRPWLLMDADASLALVTGPKRLTWDDCHRMRAMSGPSAVPTLLRLSEPESPEG